MAAASVGISMRLSHAELRRSWRNCRPNNVVKAGVGKFVVVINPSGLIGRTYNIGMC